MGNVTLPTPVFAAGGGLCLVAGYIFGAVTGPSDDNLVTAKVVSFDSATSHLCLKGKSVEGKAGAKDGVLCGTWNRSAGMPVPRKGDTFRFVVTDTSDVDGAKPRDKTVIFGTVVE